MDVYARACFGLIGQDFMATPNFSLKITIFLEKLIFQVNAGDVLGDSSYKEQVMFFLLFFEIIALVEQPVKYFD